MMSARLGSIPGRALRSSSDVASRMASTTASSSRRVIVDPLADRPFSPALARAMAASVSIVPEHPATTSAGRSATAVANGASADAT